MRLDIFTCCLLAQVLTALGKPITYEGIINSDVEETEYRDGNSASEQINELENAPFYQDGDELEQNEAQELHTDQKAAENTGDFAKESSFQKDQNEQTDLKLRKNTNIKRRNGQEVSIIEHGFNNFKNGENRIIYEQPRSARYSNSIQNNDNENIKKSFVQNNAEAEDNDIYDKADKSSDSLNSKYNEKEESFTHFETNGNDLNSKPQNANLRKVHESTLDLLRERRLAENVNDDKQDEKDSIIKHVKMLSTAEFSELINSLSEDKKNLLAKIMDDIDSLHKREITKKAGALEENYIGSDSVESNKYQSVSPSANINAISSLSQSTDETDIEKSTKISTGSTNPQTESTTFETDQINLGDKKLSKTDSLNDNSNAAKKESKREALLDNIYNAEWAMNDDLDAKSSDTVNIDEEECERTLDDTIDSVNTDENKREASESDPDSSVSIEKLEDSFPNLSSDGSSYFQSEMLPLVRVKRNSSFISQIIPEGPAAFESSIDENVELDEGTKLGDDKFYTYPNYDKIKRYLSKENSNQSPTLDVTKLDAEKLGSDTDMVLSGVEGVDDNLMYNSATRNRRDLDTKNEQPVSSKFEYECRLQDTPIVSNYQNPDIFNNLAKSYVGELGRFKRIRNAEKSIPETKSI